MTIIRVFTVVLVICVSTVSGNDNITLNLQYHFDFRRDHPTVTQEFFAPDHLGYSFFFMDVNMDHNLKQGGASDFYFEMMRYFKLKSFRKYILYFTVQYDDGSEPIGQVWLTGINIGNLNVGSFNLSTEFLLKKEYNLNLNWQYTLVWYAEFLNGKLVFNGFFDYWVNDVNNKNWPAFDPEIAVTKYSFQAEPQIGWMLAPHWKLGSEVEIGRGFLGSVTGRLALREKYQHDKWYILPTLFIQYNF